MKVLVCGGRQFNDYLNASLALDDLNLGEGDTIIEGGASGADACAFNYATYRGISCETFQADWQAHGKKAGPIRNQRMLDEGKPDMVVAFPGGKGTADMKKRAKKAGLVVWEPYGS